MNLDKFKVKFIAISIVHCDCCSKGAKHHKKQYMYDAHWVLVHSLSLQGTCWTQHGTGF